VGELTYGGDAAAAYDRLMGRVSLRFAPPCCARPASRPASGCSTSPPARLCCKVCSGLRMATVSGRSGSDLELLGDEASLSPHVASANLPNLPRHRQVERSLAAWVQSDRWPA
jgi:hypothetical protein